MENLSHNISEWYAPNDTVFISKNYKGGSHIKISFLSVIRGDINTFYKSVSSVFDLASFPDNIEILVRFDNDDNSYEEFIKSDLMNQYNIKVFVGERVGYSNIYRMTNQLFLSSVGYFVTTWGNGTLMHTRGWDEEVYKYVNDFFILYSHGYAKTIHGFSYDHLSRLSPFIPRFIFNITGYYSILPLVDAYLDRLSYTCGIRKNINISVSSDLTTVSTGMLWDSFLSPESQNILKVNADKIISYMKRNNILYRNDPYIDVRFYDNKNDSSAGTDNWAKHYPVVEILGGGGDEGRYKVYFIDQKDNSILHFSELSSFCWTCFFCNRYVNFLIKVSDMSDNIIYEYHFDLKDKKILVHISTTSADYIEECLFYIDIFCKQHSCIALCSSELLNYSFTNNYPLIKSVNNADISNEYSSLLSEDVEDIFNNRPIFIKYIIDIDGLVGTQGRSVKDVCSETLGII